ncbi:ABC transporter substrate-binding protein [Tessaracoccus defluvii]|uniref:ABC transporter substrate-binding protein n=1 Tax=Tessaracoccus defluvii TaxID=1285901 RepID=A0A7H0H578_9ACTN|nr:ABC transporter substrate-binding protein [Tessaracoccus defluvii]QNP55694.1 ABC transporter substrate-binding protein [Tessaracoccus defluvii]
MKKLFRLCALALGASLAFTACAGGGGGGGGGGATDPAPSSSGSLPAVNEDGTVNDPESVEVDPNKLVFWSLFSGGDGAFMDQIITDYNGTSPSKGVQSVMLVWADYYTKLSTAVAANRGPDIGVSHVSKLPELVAKGIVQPIDEYATAAGTNWDDYPKASVDSVTFDGEKYAIPLDTHAWILYTNSDLLTAAGVAPDGDGMISIESSEEFLDVLGKIKASAPEGTAPISLSQQGDDPYRTWWATYFQLGGTPIVSDDGSEITIDKDKAVEAAEFVNSIWADGYSLEGIQDAQQLFQEGKAGMFFGGTWAVGPFSGTDGLNFGLQPFPSLFNGSDAGWADSHVLIIPTKKDRSAEDTQAAVDFINYVASEGGLTWASSGQIPSNKTVTDNPEYAKLPFRSNYMEAKETAILPPQNENFYALKETMITNLNMIWAGQAEPAQGIEDMISEMESDLS